MGDVEIPPDESVDPPATRTDPDFAWWDRSRCRTPMPWAPGPGAGFTTGRPWLRLGPDTESRNVRRQAADPSSVLSVYRRLLALRAATPALQVGSLRLDPRADGDVVAFSRETPDQVVVVAVNVGRGAASWRVPGTPDGPAWRWRFGTSMIDAPDGAYPGGTVRTMAPGEAVILERQG
jgi:glycosidase